MLRSLRVGDILVFRHPVYGTLIKRLESLSPDGEELFVVGEHAESADSRQFGPVRRRAVIGKVIWHFRKPA